jgi:hypothetical protein
MTARLRLAAAPLMLVAMASLASGCSKRKPDSAENVAEPTQVEVAIPSVPAPEPVIPVAPPPIVNEVELPAEQLSEAEQIQEDADATGMTSRLPPGGDQPVETPAQ